MHVVKVTGLTPRERCYPILRYLVWNGFNTLLVWNQNWIIIVYSDSRFLKDFWFFEPFCALWKLQNAKSAKMAPKIFLSQHPGLWFFSPFSTVFKSSHPSNFLCLDFFATFSTDSKSASNSAFSDTHIENIEKYFWDKIALFTNFEAKCSWNGAKNRKTQF